MECLEEFKSKPTYNMIKDLSDIALNDSLSACVNGMMVDGRDVLKEESYNSWVSVVTQEIDRNGIIRKKKADVVSNLKSITCPSQCNGNGNCINGTCVCKDDYGGDSCFVKTSATPKLTDIEGGGECDLADGDDCHDCLQFHTENLLKGFKCRIETVDLDVNGTAIYSVKHDRDGEYESVFDGYCCPSAVEKRKKKRAVTSNTFTVRYSVSISNDGIHYGPSRNVHVFDSTCQSYVNMPTGYLIFSLKADTCYIDSQCYRDGERSLDSPFLICCPFVTSYEWTNRQDCVPPTSNQENGGESSNLSIVAVSVSVSGVFLVAGVVVFAIWTYKSKRRSVWPVPTTKAEPPKCPDYTELDFSKVKFESVGKAVFQPNN
ncbi:von Willebrand factor D and EGF domain-containing protein-like [Ruditapes philippinarum]|uniref:von Willebrand factor D and EGF domain-containing protein-like n=1 Tax=Ruditapes philippinarum TaxID=129788 RepID=UPI00295BAA06|nr:von Willebrand factor D and EGF domain-containing protein-like [Ruditapes philippinarum]